MVVGAGFKPARNRNHIQIENQIEKRNVKGGTLFIPSQIYIIPTFSNIFL